MRPGPNVTVSTATPPTTSPVNTGTLFAVGPAESGPVTPVLLTNFAQFQRIYGGRYTVAPEVSDAAEKYFEEGGTRLWFCRSVKKEEKAAKAEFKNEAKAAFCITVEAIGPGPYGNNIKVKVVTVKAAEEFRVEVIYKGEVVESTPIFKTVKEFVEWAKISLFIKVTETKNELPFAEEITLTTGEEKGNLEIKQLEERLVLFTPEMGPGQLVAWGGTANETASIEFIIKQATKEQRRAIVDSKRGASKAELKTLAEAIKALASPNPRNVYIMASWQECAGVAGTVTVRNVPGSAFVAAKCAIVDSLGNPNRAPAGTKGVLATSLGFSTSAFTEAEVEELSTLGVNVCKNVGGQIRIYGSRTAAQPEKDPLYTQFNNSRLDMAIIWKGLAIEEEFVFSQIDGEGKDQTAYGNALKAMMLELYKVGAVFGASPQEAFNVDTGADVNTLATEAAGELNATIAARRSPGAEKVNLNIVRVGVTQEV